MGYCVFVGHCDDCLGAVSKEGIRNGIGLTELVIRM